MAPRGPRDGPKRSHKRSHGERSANAWRFIQDASRSSPAHSSSRRTRRRRLQDGINILRTKIMQDPPQVGFFFSCAPSLLHPIAYWVQVCRVADRCYMCRFGRRLVITTNGSERCPRPAKDGPKTAQKAPRRAEEGPEKGPKGAQDGPEAAQAGFWTTQARASPHWTAAPSVFRNKPGRFGAVLGSVLGPKLGR